MLYRSSDNSLMAIRIVRWARLPLAFLTAFACMADSCNATTALSTTTTYQSSSEDFPNPERGLFAPFEPLTNNSNPPLKLAALRQVRSENITLVRKIYLLAEFRNKPLSQTFLDLIAKDCQTARAAGVKLIVRFSYNWFGGGEDARRETILSHLEQLNPVLKANYDVIAYMEAGFIGAWGQWNRSHHNLIDNWTLGVTEQSRAIFSKILSVLPATRMVVLPYPKQKMEIFGTTNPLSASKAFNGSGLARTGVHNDSFLAGPDDWGFYTYGKVERDKTFLNVDNQYVVHGGETATDDSGAQPYITCRNALKELAYLRWSVLNSFNSGYGDGRNVLQRWERDGCMPEIKRRLGYRLRLLSSTISARVKPAGAFSMKIEMTNDGWASPYNPRGFEVLLRNRQTGNKYRLRLQESVRRWLPGKTKVVEITAGLPATMPAGEYQVLLNLPDPAAKLRNRPEYSIRLANQNLWEASTGYNFLLQTLFVDSNSGGSNYSGSQFFVLY